MCIFGQVPPTLVAFGQMPILGVTWLNLHYYFTGSQLFITVSRSSLALLDQKLWTFKDKEIFLEGKRDLRIMGAFGQTYL
jgi:hypothetical protein